MSTMDWVLVGDVTVIDGTGNRDCPRADVLLEGPTITRIAPPNTLPRNGVRVVDGGGKFLTPGFWDTEVHLTRTPNGVLADLTPSWADGSRMALLAEDLRCYLRNGITTVVDLGGPTEILAQARDLLSPGPRLLIVGRQFCARGDRPLPAAMRPNLTEVGSAQEVADAVRDLLRYRPAAIKVNHHGTDRVVLDALVAAAAEHGLPVLAHVDDVESAVTALEAGVDNIEHMVAPTTEGIERIIELCLRQQAYWPLTFTVFEAVRRAGDGSYLDELDLRDDVPQLLLDQLTGPDSLWWNPEVLAKVPPLREHLRSFPARFEAALEHAERVHRAGVLTTVSTDAGNPAVFHGRATHREMELMVRAGIHPIDVIACATSLAARKFRRDDVLGTVEVGKIADLVLLSADPRLDISNTRAVDLVFQAGTPLPPAELR